jgi:hypothetical protein
MDSPQNPESNRPWLSGVLISALGVLIGGMAFALFCFALGLNFSDQGWPENQNPWQTNRVALVGSFAGFGIAILVFWLGLIDATRSTN